MSYDLAHEEAGPDNMEHLRNEFGWHEVAEGLGKILLSYAVLIIGTLLGVGLAVGALVLALDPNHQRGDLTHVWVFYIGLGILSLVGLIAYCILLAGKWRCLMGAPERNSSRWLMFACMTCIVMGPALNIVVGWTGVAKKPVFKEGVLGFKHLKFTRLGGHMQIASGVIGFGSLIFFLLFLKAIARSFDHRGCLLLINFYMTFAVLMIGATLYVFFYARQLLLKRDVLISLGVGWIIAALWYLVLIAKTRWCIIYGMKQIRSPLDPDMPC
jgi:hypothetical protein